MAGKTKTRKSGGASKKAHVTGSSKAGITFPVGRLNRFIK